MSVYKLRDLGTFKNGANYPKDSYGNGIPIVNVKDLFTPRYVDLSELVELKPNILKNENDYTIENYDILFSRSSLVQSGAGMCAMVYGLATKTLFCGFIIRFRISRKDLVNPLYLLYLLRTPTYRKLFTGTQQTNIANINQDSLGDIEVDLPSLEVQNRIVSVLNNIDDKVDNNKSICSDLEALAKEIYDYWFVQFDFPDENGKPYKSSGGKMVWNEELKREIPEGWKVKPLKDCIAKDKNALVDGPFGSQMKTKEYVDSGIPIYEMEQLNGLFIVDKPKHYITEMKYEEVKRSTVVNGDIIISKTGTLGLLGLVRMDDDKGIIVSRLAKITPDASVIGKYALLTYLKSLTDIGYWLKVSGGSTMPILNNSIIGNVPTIIPSNNLYQIFESKVELLFERIYIIQTENQQLTKLRDFLLPLFMNGQISVE